jgi:3-oxoacyl-[acyl-carrier-protein] synthase-3
MTATRARVVSVGTAVPEQIVTNKDLEQILDTTDEWIVKRTGIRERHVSPRPAPPDQAAHLGALAAQRCLQRGSVPVLKIDCVICPTFTPDNFFPSTACAISNRIGCPQAAAFDISAACAGFVYGLTIANSFIVSGQFKTVLVVGTEVTSRTLDWTDRTTCILFGDGAGAVVVEATTDQNSAGILATSIAADSSLGDILSLPAWDGKQKMSMKGNEVFRYAVRMMSQSILTSLSLCSMKKEVVDLIIPHQANQRIIEAITHQLSIPSEKVICNVGKYGNTSSASIPLAMEEAWNMGKINPGTVIAIVALGGGLSVGSAIVRF